MLKPSKKHFLRYDAQTYETQGFIEVSGKVREMAQKPRYWQVTVTPITTDGQQLDRTHIKFTTDKRAKLSELAPVINEHIFSLDDFLEKCVSVNVCARVMTEGGL
jgi:hypothetical protein